MKVIHFIWSANFGGIEKLVIMLASEQQKNKNLRSSILIGSRKGKFLELLRKSDLPFSFAGLNSGFSFSVSKFKRIKKQFESCDIIHLHTFNPLVALAAIKSGKKIVFTVHGNFGFGRKRNLADRLLQILCGYFIRHHVDYVTYNSEFSRRYAQGFYQLKNPVNEALIYNAIPTAGFTEKEMSDNSGINLSGFVIGTASRFAGFKRIDRLIEAFSIFSSNKPDCMLLLVGDGVEMAKLKKLAAEKGIENKVIFPGYQENVFQWLNKMDVCVFPSENEPFGIVALEALSLGKPVLVFADGGGLTEIIKPLNSLNIADSIPQMVERLNYYYMNREALASEEKINRQYVARFNITANEQAYFNVYNQVMNKNAG